MWLCGQAQFDLPASLLLSAASEVLGADLPSEMVLQGEATPGLARMDIPGPHPQQDQVAISVTANERSTRAVSLVT